MAQSMPKNIAENLTRLSAKPGVQYTLILSRKDGAIVQSTGLPTAEEHQDPSVADQDDSQSAEHQASTAPDAGARQQAPDAQAPTKTAENIARLVFAFVTASGELADALEPANDVQLLRLRTAKGEILIFPDTKFLQVVVRDPPKAAS